MTLHDVEVVELLAGRPELLAIADAVSGTQQRPARPGRRQLALRSALVAAVAVAVVVAILAAPQGPSGIVGRALAAVGGGPIMHVVTESQTGAVFVDLKTGHRTVQTVREELWADRQFNRWHVVVSLHGHVVGDVLWPADAGKGTTGRPTPDPAFIALWTGYRAALKNGTATLAGRGTVLGRRVYWLRFETPSRQPPVPHPPRTEVAVDARTYRPILERTYANGTHLDTRILVARAIPYAPAEFERRGPDLGAAGTSETSSGTARSGAIEPSAPPPTAVRAPWLTAGKTAAGLKLSSARPFTVTTSTSGKKSTFEGFELGYGPLSHGMPSFLATTVDELPRPDDDSLWSRVPAGSVEVEASDETTSTQTIAHPRPRNSTYRVWTGYLVKHGLYLTIRTPAGEHALLTIARRLHPAG